jgi:hypothetical protein
MRPARRLIATRIAGASRRSTLMAELDVVLTRLDALDKRLGDQGQAVNGRLDDLGGDAMRARFHRETEVPEEGSAP